MTLAFIRTAIIKGARHPELVSGSHFQEWDSNEEDDKDAETSSA
jgi:hypothetical protein